MSHVFTSSKFFKSPFLSHLSSKDLRDFKLGDVAARWHCPSATGALRHMSRRPGAGATYLIDPPSNAAGFSRPPRSDIKRGARKSKRTRLGWGALGKKPRSTSAYMFTQQYQLKLAHRLGYVCILYVYYQMEQCDPGQQVRSNRPAGFGTFAPPNEGATAAAAA